MRFKLNQTQEKWNNDSKTDFSELSAVFLSCTLKKSPEVSNAGNIINIANEVELEIYGNECFIDNLIVT